jgi:uncharacterized membrane protein YgcG
MVLAFTGALLVPVVAGPLARLYCLLVLLAARALVAPLGSSGEAGRLAGFLGERGSLTMEQAGIVMGWLGGRYQLVAVLVVVVLMILVWRRDPGRRFRNRHDLWSLLKVGSRHFPCLAPIVKSGPVIKQPNFHGPWALARTPLQFVLEEGVLLNPKGGGYKPEKILDYETGLPRRGNPAIGRENKLDLAGLANILVLQLGPPFNGRLEELPGHRFALAAALIAHRLDKKDQAFRVFDSLSVSWDPKTNMVDARPAEKVWAEIESDPLSDFGDLFCRSAYENVWFMSLLKSARVKGVLPSSLWIWLKPADRLLFYCLNQVGGRAAWADGAGAWSHLDAETEEGLPLRNPRVETAVAALTAHLRQEGYLPPPPGTRSGRPKGGGGGGASSGGTGGASSDGTGGASSSGGRSGVGGSGAGLGDNGRTILPNDPSDSMNGLPGDVESAGGRDLSDDVGFEKAAWPPDDFEFDDAPEFPDEDEFKNAPEFPDEDEFGGSPEFPDEDEFGGASEFGGAPDLPDGHEFSDDSEFEDGAAADLALAREMGSEPTDGGAGDGDWQDGGFSLPGAGDHDCDHDGDHDGGGPARRKQNDDKQPRGEVSAGRGTMETRTKKVEDGYVEKMRPGAGQKKVLLEKGQAQAEAQTEAASENRRPKDARGQKTTRAGKNSPPEKAAGAPEKGAAGGRASGGARNNPASPAPVGRPGPAPGMRTEPGAGEDCHDEEFLRDMLEFAGEIEERDRLELGRQREADAAADAAAAVAMEAGEKRRGRRPAGDKEEETDDR